MLFSTIAPLAGLALLSSTPSAVASHSRRSKHAVNKAAATGSSADITTCGQWAGEEAVWQDRNQSGSCSASYATCAQAMQDSKNFEDAFFEISYVKVYSV
ncbi:hypothetical protein JCM10213v2_004409 [Rhodosporidiobolus nylandii]